MATPQAAAPPARNVVRVMPRSLGGDSIWRLLAAALLLLLRGPVERHCSFAGVGIEVHDLVLGRVAHVAVFGKLLQALRTDQFGFFHFQAAALVLEALGFLLEGFDLIAGGD